MTKAELQQLDDEALLQYFLDNARHRPDAPDNAKYNIRLGSRHLHDSETHLLRDQFFEAVRSQ